MKKAIVTGVTGQDGAYLSELLLSKGYKVYGAIRRTSSVNLWRVNELNLLDNPNFELVSMDICDPSCCIRVVDRVQPDEIYNLAAQSFVGVSFEQPMETSNTTGIAVLNLLEAIRIVNKNIRFYQASTSEMFGGVHEVPQSEATMFYPKSPYGVAKLYGHWMSVNYRESYDMFCSSGILFNHESPLRGKEFVTRKITDMVAKIHLGKVDVLELGNLNAKRDWGFAKEYVEAMYLMLQHDESDTFVVATNRTETVRDFVTMAFKAVGTDIVYEGENEQEIGKDSKTGKTILRVSPEFYRPAEVDILMGDPSKAKEKLGWAPQTTLEELCAMMVENDVRRNKVDFQF